MNPDNTPQNTPPTEQVVAADTQPIQQAQPQVIVPADVSVNSETQIVQAQDSMDSSEIKRVGRAQYRKATVIYLTAVTILTITADVLISASTGPLIMLVWLIAFALLLLLLKQARATSYRLQDIGVSGLFAILLLVPVVNLLLMFYLLFPGGQITANKYGPPPIE